MHLLYDVTESGGNSIYSRRCSPKKLSLRTARARKHTSRLQVRGEFRASVGAFGHLKLGNSKNRRCEEAVGINVREESPLPLTEENSTQDYRQSGGGCLRPQNCGAAVLKQRPTSVLPPCFSPRYTTRQSCSSRFGDISQDEPLAQSDRCGQSNEATVSTKYDGARRVFEWGFVGQLALNDHWQLRLRPPGTPEVRPDPMVFDRPVHHKSVAY